MPALLSSPALRAQGMSQNNMGRMPGMGDAKKEMTGSVTGTITAINAADHKVTLNHGPITEIKWPAMKMEFPVVPSVDLSKIKVGDKVRFTVSGSCSQLIRHRNRAGIAKFCMSALGQKRTFIHLHPMSALPPIADIGTQQRDVCFVP